MDATRSVHTRLLVRELSDGTIEYLVGDSARRQDGWAEVPADLVGKIDWSIISKQLADAIDGPLDTTAKIKCERIEQRNCIEPQLAVKQRVGRKLGWHDANPKKMCASCACYWHLSCARNFALGVVR